MVDVGDKAYFCVRLCIVQVLREFMEGLREIWRHLVGVSVVALLYTYEDCPGGSVPYRAEALLSSSAQCVEGHFSIWAICIDLGPVSKKWLKYTVLQ